MRFNISTLLSGLFAATALAAPAAEPVASPDNDPNPPSAKCSALGNFDTISWKLYNILHWGQDDWYPILFGNLGEKCGTISNSELASAVGGWKVTFTTAGMGAVDPHCVEKAISVSGGPADVHCDWTFNY